MRWTVGFLAVFSSVYITNATTMKNLFSHNCWVCQIKSSDVSVHPRNRYLMPHDSPATNRLNPLDIISPNQTCKMEKPAFLDELPISMVMSHGDCQRTKPSLQFFSQSLPGQLPVTATGGCMDLSQGPGEQGMRDSPESKAIGIR